MNKFDLNKFPDPFLTQLTDKKWSFLLLGLGAD